MKRNYKISTKALSKYRIEQEIFLPHFIGPEYPEIKTKGITKKTININVKMLNKILTTKFINMYLKDHTL